jgi:hypothetical protein
VENYSVIIKLQDEAIMECSGCLVAEEDFLLVDVLLRELTYSLTRVLHIEQLTIGRGPIPVNTGQFLSFYLTNIVFGS